MVIDAGVVLALVLPLPFSNQASACIRSAREAREDLYAPALLEYEVCSALRRAVSRRLIDEDTASRAMSLIEALGIRPITPASSLHERALKWAALLQQSKAYDGQYVALAEEMHCDLLTADQRLAHAAQALGATWVKSLG